VTRHLGPEQPFYLLEPYKFDGLPFPPSFEAMAAAYLEVLREIQPEGPYQFGGYCNGALFAYEMARQLHAQGQTVDLLLMIDAEAPARHRWFRRAISNFGNLMRIDEEKQFKWFLRLQHIVRYLRFSHYRQSKNSELLGTIEQAESGHKADKVGSVPLSLTLKALFPTIETLRQDYLSIHAWSASGYAPALYAGKMTFFWTSEEPWRPVGWHKIVKAKEKDVEVRVLPGNHITLRTEHLPVLAENFRTCLNKAQTTTMN
jgi:thioesterase domain-containing protein